MKEVAAALFEAESTRGRKAKVDALARALAGVASRDPAHLPFVARFITGTLLPTDDARVLGAGGSLVFEAACLVTGASPDALGAKIGRAGDMGTAVGEAMEEASRGGSGLALSAAEDVAHALASTGARADKLHALVSALTACTPLEARYLARAVLGEMRVGAKEGIAIDAVAKAFDAPLDDVRRAAGIIADVGELARLAHEKRLADARIVLGRPVGFMLATPIETARSVDLDGVPHAVEEKIDGIRAQLHVTPAGTRIFARGKGAVTTAFPDIVRPLDASPELPSVILDGEIVVIASDGDSLRVRPFSALQPRLKKTVPDEALLRDLPVVYLAYDMLYEDGASLLDLPFRARRERLAAWVAKAPPPITLHASKLLPSKDALDAEFDAARARGFEGLVLKRLDAPYAAGVRGFSWLKVKKAFGTLDCVVVAAERGHGKRAGVLSDYTFAVWSEDDPRELLVVGKAYSGLTDEEIRVMTARLEALALGEERRGYLPVKPEIVLEVGFDGLQKSTRHASGFAMRFPRIVAIRDDKKPEEADTLADVRALFDSQVASGHREEQSAKPPKKGGRKSGRRPDIRQKTKQLKLFGD